MKLIKTHFKTVVNRSFYKKFNIILIKNIKSYYQINELFFYNKNFFEVFFKPTLIEHFHLYCKKETP